MYKLIIEFRDIEDLRRKLAELLQQLGESPRLEARVATATPSTGPRGRVPIVFDETVRDVGSIAKRVARDFGIDVEVYEVSTSVTEVSRGGESTLLPIKDDLDVLTWARKLGAVLVTGDKKLARTAETYGVKVVYLPPSSVVSKEHYVIEALKRVRDLVAGER
ncbi:MAG: hypothetical protein GXO32_00210 [Crenarchaeota archaeon]|nr:hypothetical protein [Thermoproteota archaeon]